MTTVEAHQFNARWEADVYAHGRQMNRYPFPAYIGPFLSLFGRAPDRSQIKVLEVGCGAGNNIWLFAREGFSTHGIEGSASALAYAQDRLAAEGLSADLRRGDFQHLPYADGSMDFVLDRGSITHNTRPVIEATLAEVHRVLKPNGAFFSQMFTNNHTDLRFAREFSDGSAPEFTAGYFAGIGRTFFATRADLDALFGARFELQSIERESHENMLTGDVSAVWNVLMRKSA
jgi:SAM-dependent methyltransferase